MRELKIQITENLIQEVINIARQAGAAIMEVYSTDFDIEIKDDRSPVTNADKQANAIILRGLNHFDGSIPILSEEEKEIVYQDRKEWGEFWLVDPLDGTKDFIKKNDEFTVNIALVEESVPVFGVVYAPALDILYWGSVEYGAWKQTDNNLPQKIFPLSDIDDTVIIVGSRSHPSRKMEIFLSQFKTFNLQPMGSSLKICLVSDGSVHLYPRLGPTMEWDTAAAHAVLRASGGEMINIGTSQPLQYNKQDLLNPAFIAGNMSIIQGLSLIN